MSQTTETPRETLAIATLEHALPRARLTLIGTLIKPGSSKALLRINNARIRSVVIGDKIAGGRVIAIDEGILVLEKYGVETRLTLPAS